MRVSALNEKRVRIVAIGQQDTTRYDAQPLETVCQRLRRLRAAAVGVGIKAQIDNTLGTT